MQDIVNPIGRFLEWSFGLLEKMENLPNIIFLLMGIGGIAFWLTLQYKYNKKAEAEGTIK